MQKFVVVSYDNDEQQWFWDYVTAPTADKAVAMVCKDRPYVIAAYATTVKQLRAMANDLEKLNVYRVSEQYKRTIKEA
jgi:hypothetical protein